MSAADIVKLILTAGIVLTVISVGLRARPADTYLLLRNPALGLRAMLSMFILMPMLVIGLTWALPVLGQAPRAALIALSISPMPPILPRRQTQLGAEGDYAVGLQVLASVFSIIVAPIFIWLAGQLYDVATIFDAGAMLRVLAITIGAPLAAGILISRVWPRAAAFSAMLGGAALLLLAVGGAVAAYAEAREMVAQTGNGVLLVTATVVLLGLLVGHLLGGPDPGNRGALALATSARHPGLAIALSTAVFPHDKEAIVAVVLLFLLTNVVLTMPYILWRKRRAHSV